MYPIYILAGGLAKRLGKISKSTPKCMLPIKGKPFIYYQLKKIKEYNSNISITLCLGHLSEEIVKYIKNSEFQDLNLSFSFDGDKRLGTGGAIKKAVRNETQPFFVMYGDSYLDISFLEVEKKYNPSSPGPLMTIYENNGMYDQSNISLEDGNITYSKSFPQSDSNYIDYGLAIYKKEHFAKDKINFDLSEIQEYYSLKKELQFFETFNRFFEIGSIEGLNEFREFL